MGNCFYNIQNQHYPTCCLWQCFSAHEMRSICGIWWSAEVREIMINSPSSSPSGSYFFEFHNIYFFSRASSSAWRQTPIWKIRPLCLYPAIYICFVSEVREHGYQGDTHYRRDHRKHTLHTPALSASVLCSGLSVKARCKCNGFHGFVSWSAVIW
jgi:hypothetical protein